MADFALRRMSRGQKLAAGLTIGALIAVAAGWGVAYALTASTSSATTGRTVTFTPVSTAFENPERGWFEGTDILTDRSFDQAQVDGVTLLHSYIELDAYRDRALPASVLTSLQEGLDAVRQSGLKVILRVAYNQGPYPNSQPDATVARIEQQIKQLSPIFDRNSDVIFSFEAGYIGAWGEWHTSTHGTDKNAAAKAEVYKSILAAYPKNRSVALRYPSDIRALIGTPPTGNAAFDGSTVDRTGNHQDCFLSSVPDDNGTWGRDGTHSVAADKALIAKVGDYSVVGGETCGMSSRVNCTTATKELAQMHFTYLNRQFDPTVLATLAKDGCETTIGTHLGYRFELRSATAPSSASSGGTLPFSFTVRNVGDAHLVNARTAYAVLTRGTKTVTVKLTTDPRRWAAGTTTTVRQNLTLPANMAAGRWKVSLWLPDASSTLAGNPAYSIRFADAGTWNATTGMNPLGMTVTIH